MIRRTFHVQSVHCRRGWRDVRAAAGELRYEPCEVQEVHLSHAPEQLDLLLTDPQDFQFHPGDEVEVVLTRREPASPAAASSSGNTVLLQFPPYVKLSVA